MNEQETENKVETMVCRSAFGEWWSKNFIENDNFKTLSDKMKHDFQSVAWHAYKAAWFENKD